MPGLPPSPFRKGDTLETLVVRGEKWALFDALSPPSLANPRLLKRTLSGTSDVAALAADEVRNASRGHLVVPAREAALTMVVLGADAQAATDPYR